MDIPQPQRVNNVVLRTADLMRVANLRRRTWTPEAAEHLAIEMTKALRTPYGQMTLKPMQAISLYELTTEKGGFFPLAVGAGKTLLSLLAPVVLQRAYNVGHRPLLIVPASLIEKTERDAKSLADHWQLARFYKIVSFEFLGRVQAGADEKIGYKGAIEEFAPDFVFIDECHRAKNRRKAAVARRLHRFFASHPIVICAAASGTVTTRSIHDYAHIIRWCHPPQHVPLPLHWNELEAWARALDERPSEPGEPGALEILCNAEEQAIWRTDRHTAARLAYRRRLVETPGVVATKASSVGATLIIRGVQPKRSEVIDEGFDILRTWETPDGWPIDDGIAMARHARELAAGFYYVWAPRPPHLWLSARKAWSKYVREKLKHSRKMDTELQVRQHEQLQQRAFEKSEAKEGMCEELAKWLEVKDTFEPNTVPVWICNSVLEFAYDWAKKHRGIIWNEHVCFGERLEKEGGIPYYGRKGRDARGHFIDDHPAEQSFVASIASNKEGRNLQKWSENLVLGWPSSGGIAEQMQGRTHRNGQLADEVTFDVIVSCIEHFGAFEQSRRDANYIETSTGSQQKLNLATIDMPDSLIGLGSRWTK